MILSHLADGNCTDLPDPDVMFPPEWWRESATASKTALWPDDEAVPTEDALADAEAEAKFVCVGCPVRAVCLAGALQRDERAGVWGGLLTRERDVLLAQVSRSAQLESAA